MGGEPRAPPYGLSWMDLISTLLIAHLCTTYLIVNHPLKQTWNLNESVKSYISAFIHHTPHHSHIDGLPPPQLHERDAVIIMDVPR